MLTRTIVVVCFLLPVGLGCPAGNPAMPPVGTDERSVVMRSWRAVQRAVQDNMALNPGSDVVRFNGAELGRSIRWSMASGRVENQSQQIAR